MCTTPIPASGDEKRQSKGTGQPGLHSVTCPRKKGRKGKRKKERFLKRKRKRKEKERERKKKRREGGEGRKWEVHSYIAKAQSGVDGSGTQLKAALPFG